MWGAYWLGTSGLSVEPLEADFGEEYPVVIGKSASFSEKE